MYVHCKNTRCFWHSDIEPNKCTRGLIIIGENANCKMIQCENKHNLIEEVPETFEVAEDIFKRLYQYIKFDGHAVAVWKNDLVQIAKEYGVILE